MAPKKAEPVVEAGPQCYISLNVTASGVLLLSLLQETGPPKVPPTPQPASPTKPGAKGVPPPAAPVAVDLSQLTLGPLRLVTPEDAKGAQVVTLSISSVGPLPEGLAAAAAMAGGALSFSCGLVLPLELGAEGAHAGTHAFMLPGGVFKDGALRWPTSKVNFFAPVAAVAALKAAADAKRPLLLELGRYLTPGTDALTDPAYEAYHGIAEASVGKLLAEPGRTSVAFSAAAKPLEEAPAAGSACAWVKAGTVISAELQLQQPLCPAWKPPPQPSVQLQDLIPRRDLAPKVVVPTAAEAFRQQVQVAAKQLALQYQQTFGDHLRDPVASADPQKAAQRRKQMMFELNRSGQYLQLQEQLRACVVRIVQEHFHKAGTMDRQDMQGLHNKLYVVLTTEMHKALNQLREQGGEPAPAAEGAQMAEAAPSSALLSTEKLKQLQGLADEAELNGDARAAVGYHEQRVMGSTSAQAWYEFAAFSMRTCSLDRAEQCLRKALAIDPGHQDALLALGCLLWHSGLHTDAAFLQQAAVLLLHAKDDLLAAHPVAAAMAQEQQVLPGTEPQPAEEQQGQPALAGRPPPASSPRGGVQQSVAVVWALLGLVYGAAGQDEERRNCSFEAYRLGLLQLQGALASQPLLQAALLLLDLQLGTCADWALQALADAEPAASLAADIAVCKSRAAFLCGREEEAMAQAHEATRLASPEDIRPHVLLGNMHAAAGRPAEASAEYQAALQKQPTACPLDVYLRLGRAFAEQDQHEYARNVFVQACTVRPCASTWLGAGTAYLNLRDLQQADLCLMEANTLNNQDANIWGHAALLAILADHAAEAEQALTWALKLRLQDTALVAQIAEQLIERHRQARVLPLHLMTACCLWSTCSLLTG
eukprot:jgi/Astpho2/1607/fgenesh1_pg.00028_%23_15_t